MHTALACGSLFLEGLLSFFSPCVLPLIPLYLGYLTNDAKSIGIDGKVKYSRWKTLFFTLFFILGILFVYVIAGIGTGAFHDFFIDHKVVIECVGGIILLFLGLVNLHVIRIPFLQSVHQKQVDVSGKMTWLKAWILGFFFSFAWSPCTGPLLAQAIVMASTASEKWIGWLYIGAYACGFICVFLLLGLFTEEVLNLLKKHRNIVKYTGIVASVLVLGSGCYILYDAYLSYQAMASSTKESIEKTESTNTRETLTIDSMNFQLRDISGNVHSLLDYKGKTIIVNFFGTWCYYCNQELPSLQEIQENDSDTKILLIASPNVNGEGDASYVDAYMKDAGYTMEVLYDDDLSVTNAFGVTGYPCTFVIRPNGEYLGYIPGYVEHDTLLQVIEDAKK